MAQWIPKTAWRVSNLNKRYGQQYVFGGGLAAKEEEGALASYATAIHQRSTREKVLKTLRAAAKPNLSNPIPGSCLVDVRDPSEQQRCPLPAHSAVSLHPHDILSGAAVPLLPWDKSRAELFIVTSNTQRGVNTIAALRRWGYFKTSVLDYESAFSLCEELLRECHTKKTTASEGG